MPRKAIAKNNRPRGRPSHLETGYNPDNGTWTRKSPAGRIITALNEGCPYHYAASAGGIHRDTFREWRTIGEQLDPNPQIEHPEDIQNWDTLTPNEQMIVRFYRLVQRAREGAVPSLVSDIRRAGRDGDWRASDRLLTIIDPERFAPRSKVDQTTQGSVAATVVVSELDLRSAIAAPAEIEEAEVVEEPKPKKAKAKKKKPAKKKPATRTAKVKP